MGRRGKPERIEALLVDWQTRIEEGERGYDSSAAGIQRLADAIGIDVANLSRRQRVQLRAAVQLLPRRLADRERPPLSDQDQIALRVWIKSFLITPGPELLITEGMRRLRLARLRDTDRRRLHAERGLHAATVELPQETWLQLHEVTKLLKAPSQRAALAHVIQDFLTRFRKQEKRRRSSLELCADNYGGLAPDLLDPRPLPDDQQNPRL
jgi:hypothetical protein